MKKLPLLILLLIVAGACKLDPIEDAWEYYEDWRNDNNQWLAEQEARVDAEGNPYYEKVVPVYDNNAYVLIHYFNDRYPGEFRKGDAFRDKLGDDILYDYIVNKVSWQEAREHVKVEEQKWIRKAKKYLLYEDAPYRIK